MKLGQPFRIRRFPARYDGRGNCGHSIYEGDAVGYSVDDELMCTDCCDWEDQNG